MLQLTKIHIKNFRSFRDATFELKDLQLLIGPNNSGKTNLLRAFEFLRKINDEEEAKHIDLDKIRFQHKEFQQERKPLPDPVEITVELSDSKENSFVYYKVELNIISDPKNSFSNQFIGVAKEKLSDSAFLSFDLQNFKDKINLFSEAYIERSRTMRSGDDQLIPIGTLNAHGPNNWQYSLTFTNGNVRFNQNQNAPYDLFLKGIYGTNLLNGYILDTEQLFSKLTIYKPDTSYIKMPIGKFQAEKSINGNCDNIASYLENLQSSDPDKFQLINKELSKSLSDFTGYNFETVDRYNNDRPKTVRYFRLKDKFGVNHLAEDISEGALYFLMLIAIINQKDIPPILMLEEPETGIHPRRISEIMEYIFILREQHPEISIILTTHHPYVVDHFSELTDRVWIFDTENGESTIKNLEYDVIEPSNKKVEAADMEPIDFTSSLGEHWALGFLGGVPKPVVRG
jgi:predicted ATPase